MSSPALKKHFDTTSEKTAVGSLDQTDFEKFEGNILDNG